MRTAADLKLNSEVWALTYKNNSNKIQKEAFYIKSIEVESFTYTLVCTNKDNTRKIKIQKTLYNRDPFEQLKEITKLSTLNEATFLFNKTVFIQPEDLNVSYNRFKYDKLIDIDKTLIKIEEKWGEINNKPLIHFIPPRIKFGDMTMNHHVALLFLDNISLHFTKPGSIKYEWDTCYSLKLIHRDLSSEFKGSLKEVVWRGYVKNKLCLLTVLDKDKTNGYGVVKLYRRQLLNEKKKLLRTINK